MDVSIIPILDDNYAYVIQTGKKIAVIDPGESAPIIDFFEAKKIIPDWVINTHKHGDHTGGNQEIIEKYGCKFAAPTECGESDFTLENEKIFEIGDTKFQIFLTKGHSQGHVILFDPVFRILFSGDILFPMGCGRVIDGSMQDMFDSIQIIKSLPPETAIYCGHEYTQKNGRFAQSVMPDNQKISERMRAVKNMKCTMPTTLATELVTNPFLIAKDINEFSYFRLLRNNF